MIDTSFNHLTGSQKVIGSIPIFSTEWIFNQLETSTLTVFVSNFSQHLVNH